MGLDLSRFATSIMFAMVLFAIFTTSYMNMALQSGTTISGSNGFNINHTLTTAQQMEASISTSGTDNTNTFFPALKSLYTVWAYLKSIGQDLTQAIESFTYTVAAGDSNITLLKTVIIVSIILAIAFIILAALFRQGSWSLGGGR